MKANELMVGDLIKTNSHSWNDETLENKYCKVEMMGQNYMSCSLIDNPKRKPYGEGTSFEPIPLTAEILEKNGFEKQQFGNFIYENDDVNLRIEFYPKNINYTNGCYDYIDIGKGCVTITEMPIEFVHELQHALRLCGIEKEIEL